MYPELYTAEAVLAWVSPDFDKLPNDPFNFSTVVLQLDGILAIFTHKDWTNSVLSYRTITKTVQCSQL